MPERTSETVMSHRLWEMNQTNIAEVLDPVSKCLTPVLHPYLIV